MNPWKNIGPSQEGTIREQHKHGNKWNVKPCQFIGYYIR